MGHELCSLMGTWVLSFSKAASSEMASAAQAVSSRLLLGDHKIAHAWNTESDKALWTQNMPNSACLLTPWLGSPSLLTQSPPLSSFSCCSYHTLAQNKSSAALKPPVFLALNKLLQRGMPFLPATNSQTPLQTQPNHHPFREAHQECKGPESPLLSRGEGSSSVLHKTGVGDKGFDGSCTEAV